MVERVVITPSIKESLCIGNRCPLKNAMDRVDPNSSEQDAVKFFRSSQLERSGESTNLLECRENGRPCGTVLISQPKAQ